MPGASPGIFLDFGGIKIYESFFIFCQKTGWSLYVRSFPDCIRDFFCIFHENGIDSGNEYACFNGPYFLL